MIMMMVPFYDNDYDHDKNYSNGDDYDAAGDAVHPAAQDRAGEKLPHKLQMLQVLHQRCQQHQQNQQKHQKRR